MPAASCERRRVDGVLLLDKPTGLSSNAALQRAKRIFNAKKAGHTGTLDPLASGLLPICFGEATKFAQHLIDADKGYRARLKLGETTASGDAESPILACRPVHCAQAEFVAALLRFEGEIDQVPPMHSALKHQGRALYEYAREGVELPRAPRCVRIARIELTAWAPPEADIEVECSKGTYIRSLAIDIGEALGCGAHLVALRRFASGGFLLEQAVTLETLEGLSPEARDRLLQPSERLVAQLRRIDLDEEGARALRHGRAVASTAEGTFRVHDAQGRFLGLARGEGGELHAQRLMAEEARVKARNP